MRENSRLRLPHKSDALAVKNDCVFVCHNLTISERIFRGRSLSNLAAWSFSPRRHGLNMEAHGDGGRCGTEAKLDCLPMELLQLIVVHADLRGAARFAATCRQARDAVHALSRAAVPPALRQGRLSSEYAPRRVEIMVGPANRAMCPPWLGYHPGCVLSWVAREAHGLGTLVEMVAAGDGLGRAIGCLCVYDQPSAAVLPPVLSGSLHSLTTLALEGCDDLTVLESLPPSVTTLTLSYCKNLASISPDALRSVKSLTLVRCSALVSLPLASPGLAVTTLSLRACYVLTSLSVSGRELAVVDLELWFCRALAVLPPLPAATSLAVQYCDSIRTLPPLPAARTLEVSFCGALTALPPLPVVTTLVAENCESLASLPPSLPAVVSLRIIYCDEIAIIPPLPAVETLRIEDCGQFSALPALPAATSLALKYCDGLTSLPALPNVDVLTLQFCPGLGVLPELPAATRIKVLCCPSARISSLVRLRHACVIEAIGSPLLLSEPEQTV